MHHKEHVQPSCGVVLSSVADFDTSALRSGHRKTVLCPRYVCPLLKSNPCLMLRLSFSLFDRVLLL